MANYNPLLALNAQVITAAIYEPAARQTISVPRRQLLLSLAAGAASACTKFKAIEDEPPGVTRFPQHSDKNCRAGASKIFDECGSQLGIFEAALTESNKTGKVLLVSYGAEWCIWCHVFDAYLDGNYGTFDYRYNNRRAAIDESGDGSMAHEAATLSRFAKDNFVLAHIESDYAKDGKEVLRTSNALQKFLGALPFVFTTNPRGKWAATFDYQKAEIRRAGRDWFRGYDRSKLRAELQAMKTAARET